MAAIDILAQRVNQKVKTTEDNKGWWQKTKDFFTDDDLDKTQYLGDISKEQEAVWQNHIMPKLKAAKADNATISQAYRNWVGQVTKWSEDNGFMLRRGQSVNQQRSQNLVQKLADADTSGSATDKLATKAKVAKVVTGAGTTKMYTGSLDTVGGLLQLGADWGENNRHGTLQKKADYVKSRSNDVKASNIALKEIEDNPTVMQEIGLMGANEVAPTVLGGGVGRLAAKGSLMLGSKAITAGRAGAVAGTGFNAARIYGDAKDTAVQEIQNISANQLNNHQNKEVKDTFNKHLEKYRKAGKSDAEAIEEARLDTINDLAEGNANKVTAISTALELIAPSAGGIGARMLTRTGGDDLVRGTVRNTLGKVVKPLARHMDEAPARNMARAVAGETSRTAMAKGVARDATKAFARQATEEGVQEGYEDYAGQKFGVDMGMRDSVDLKQTAKAATYGALLGGVMGGGAEVGTHSTPYLSARQTLTEMQQTQATTNAQLNELQQQHTALSQVANPTAEQTQQLQAIEKNIRDIETVKSENEAKAQSLNIPEPVNQDTISSNDGSNTADQISEPLSSNTTNLSHTQNNTEPANAGVSSTDINNGTENTASINNGGFDVSQHLNLDHDSLQQALINHQQEMVDNATITDGTQDMSVNDAVNVAHQVVADNNQAIQKQSGISGVSARHEQRQSQANLTNAQSQWEAEKIRLQTEPNRNPFMAVSEGEHFDTALTGMNGQNFRLATTWNRFMPANEKQQAIANAFGGQLPQKLASAKWGDIPIEQQKILYEWFDNELKKQREQKKAFDEKRQNLESNIRALEKQKSENEALAKSLGIPNDVLNRFVDKPYLSTLDERLEQKRNSNLPRLTQQPDFKVDESGIVFSSEDQSKQVEERINSKAKNDIIDVTPIESEKATSVADWVALAHNTNGKYVPNNRQIILRNDGTPFLNTDTANLALKRKKGINPNEYNVLGDESQGYVVVHKNSENSKSNQDLQSIGENIIAPDYDSKVMAKEKQSSDQRLQTTDVVRNYKNKPFKQKASAEKFQADNNLDTTHEIKAVDGGFELHRLPIAKQNAINNKSDGVQDYSDIQSQVAREMGIGVNADGEYDVTDEQFAEMNKRINDIQREQRGLPVVKAQSKEAVNMTTKSRLMTPKGSAVNATSAKSRKTSSTDTHNVMNDELTVNAESDTSSVNPKDHAIDRTSEAVGLATVRTESRIDEGGKLQYSKREQGKVGVDTINRYAVMPYERARSIVSRVIDGIRSNAPIEPLSHQKGGFNLPIEVVASFEALPEFIQQDSTFIDNDGKTQRYAVFGVWHEGTLYLNAGDIQGDVDAGITTEQMIEQTILHEIVGHYGIQKLFGDEYKKQLTQLWNAIGGVPALRKIARNNGVDIKAFERDYITPYLTWKQEERYTADEVHQALIGEMFAHIAQNGKPTVKQKLKTLVGYVRNWLLERGLMSLDKYNDSDILMFLNEAKRATVDKNYQGKFANRQISKVVTEHPMADDSRNRDDINYSKRMGAQGYQRDLMVTHNISADGIIHADKMGGLPFASIAITKQQNPLANFGEVTLIGDKNYIDPKGQNKAKVFGSDIYSPRYPSVYYEVKLADMDKLYQQFKASSDTIKDSNLHYDTHNRIGGESVETVLADSPSVQYQFLQEQGIDVPLVYKDANMSPYWQLPSVQDAIKSGVRLTDIRDDKPLLTRIMQDVLQQEQASLKAIDPNLQGAGFAIKVKQKNIHALETAIKHQDFFEDNYTVRIIGEIEKSALNPTQDKQYDLIGTKKAIRQAIDNHRQAFREYVSDIASQISVKEKLRDGETRTGEDRYVAHTLENVVKKLKKNLRGGERTDYGLPTLRAKITPQFKTVKDIQKNKTLLISDADFNAITDEVEGNLTTLASQLGIKQLDIYDFINDVVDSNVGTAMKKYGAMVSDNNIEAVETIIEKLRNMPTTYFEAKAKEVTQFSDFKGAVIPNDLPAKARKILEDAGLTLFTYDRNNPNARAEAVKNATNELDNRIGDILFSKTNKAQTIKGKTTTTPSQVRDTLVKQHGEKTITALEQAGVLHIKQLSDFVNSDGNLTIADDAEGFFHDGKAVLIADNIDPDQIMPVFLHEMGGHGGLQNMLSAPAYADLMRTFNAMVARGDEVALRAKLRAEQATDSESEATTEYLPYLLSEISTLQQRTPFIKRLLDRFVGSVRAWVFAKTGVKLNLTHADILGLAELTIKQQVKDIQTQAKLVEKVAQLPMTTRMGQRKGLFDLPDVPVVTIEAKDLSVKDTKQLADTLLRELQKAPLGTLHNNDTNWDFVIGKKDRLKMGDNNNLSHATSQAVQGLTDLVANAVLAETHQDIEHHNTDVQAVHRLYAGVLIDGKMHRVKLTVKDYKFLDGSGERKNLHAIEAVEIENAPMGTLPPYSTSNDVQTVQPTSERLALLGTLPSNQSDQIVQPTTGRSISIADLLKGATRYDGSAFVKSQIINYSRSRIPNVQNNDPDPTAKEKTLDYISKQWAMSTAINNGFLRIIRRNIGTDQHKALTHADYKRFFDLGQKSLAYTTYTASNGIDILPEVLNSRFIILKKKANIQAMTKVLFDGTLEKTVYNEQQLKDKGLTDEQIDMYYRSRQVIDDSLNNMAMDIFANNAMGTGFVSLDEVLRIKEAVIAGGGGIGMFNSAMQQAVRTKVQALEQAGIITAKKATTLNTMFDDVAKQMDAVMERTFELQDEGYVPLMRFGDYTVSVRDGKGELVYYEHHESEGEQKKAVIELSKNPAFEGMKITTSVLSSEDYAQFKNQGLSPETVMLFAKELGLDSDQANQAYLKVAINQRSALKRLIHRKEILGFSEDFPRVLSAFVMSNARYGSRLMFDGEIKRSIQGIKDGNLRKEAQLAYQDMQNPSEAFARIKTYLFFHTMGFSVAFGLLNLTQPFVQTIPHLSQYTSLWKAHTSIGSGLVRAIYSHAVEDLTRFGKMTPMGKHISTKTFAERLPNKMQADYERMRKEGHLDPQNVWLMQGKERGKSGLMSGWLSTVNEASGYIAGMTETINRRATMYAALKIAYDMGEAKLKAKGFDSPYDFAVSSIQQTQGIANKGNRMGIARHTGLLGSAGNIITVYKQYSVNLIEQQIRMGQQKQVKALVTSWVYMYAMAGIMGLPFFDDLKDIIESIFYLLGYAKNTDLMVLDTLVDKFGKEDGKMYYEMIMHGPLAPFTPADIHGRTSAGNLLPLTGTMHPSKSQKVGEELTQALGPAVGLVVNIIDSFQMVQQGRYRDAIVTSSPRMLKDGIQGVEILRNGSYRNSYGNKVMDLGKSDALIKFAQGNPNVNALRGRDDMTKYETDDMKKAVVSKFTWQMAMAISENDKEAEQQAYADMAKWNEKNKNKAFQVDPNAIYKKAKDKAKRRDLSAEERAKHPKELEKYYDELGLMDDEAMQ